jgi:parallel beta-helix repeat protein
MFRKFTVALISAGLLVFGACHTDTKPSLCTTVPEPCKEIPAGMSESSIASTIAAASVGTTVVFDTGTFKFTNGIAPPNLSGLVITGQGIGKTILDFSGQTAGASGVTASGNTNLTFSHFTIQNTPGDAIKVSGGNGITFNTVEVTWTSTQGETHGGYGFYPVQSQSILVENCQVNGAREAGIYVGQSFNIIVKSNAVKNSVAGIEIESSINADVFNNTSTGNAGGILVFALPTLQPPPGSGAQTDMARHLRVFNNTIVGNNTANFADPGGTVFGIPGGSGLIVMAAQDVEVFGNTILNNDTDALSVVSYFLIAPPEWDPTSSVDNPTGLDPFPSNIYVHDNMFGGNGTAPLSANALPDGGEVPNPLGELLAFLVQHDSFPSGGVADMVWDGLADPKSPLKYVPPAAPTNATSAGTPPNPLGYFINNNGTATFANLNFGVLVPCPDGSCSPNPSAIAFYAAPFTVTAPPPGFPLSGVDAGVLP